MLGMSLRTFRDRWPVFAGAVVTVCLGVALVQSSLLNLVSAATARIPPGLPAAEALALRSGYEAGISLLGISLGLSTFVAIFIVGTTFAFTVAQRRRDLALLRLTGASRGQVRRLLVGEALLLGTVGCLLGILLGLPTMRVQAGMLVHFGFVPTGFGPQWRSWIIAVSAGTGIGIAVLGVLVASRRASRVRPLEALRESDRIARVMTASRWILGMLFLAGGIAMVILIAALGGEAALALSVFVSMMLVVAFTALAPLVVRLASWPLGILARGPLGGLAHANLRHGVRRSASTAAPVMLLVAFVAGTAGTLDTLGKATRQEVTRTLRADLIVTTDRPVRGQLAAVDGVATVSEEVPVTFEVGSDDGEGHLEYGVVDGLAVDPVAYASTHDVGPGNLTALRGDSVAVSPSYAPELRLRVGDPLPVRLDGRTRDLRIAVLLPDTLAGPYFLLPPDLMPDSGPRRYAVRLFEGVDVSSVAARLARVGEVVTVDEWIDRNADDQQHTNLDVMTVLLGMAMLYAVIAMVNAVVIAASDRRREYATARVTGLTRGQVVASALGEASAVVATGLLLGGLAAAGTVLGIAVAVEKMVGIAVVSPQWSLLAALTAGAFVVVGVTNVLTTLATTRTPAIRLIGTWE